MVEQDTRLPPLLTPLQTAWLEELGLGKRFLARYLPTNTDEQDKPAASAPVPAASVAEAVLEPAPKAASEPGGRMFQAGQLAATLLAKNAPGRVPGAAPEDRRQAPSETPATPAPSVSSTSPAASATSASPVSAPSASSPVSTAAPPSPAPSSSPFDGLRLRVESCTACGLHGERHLPVVGSGASEAVELMVIGEAPGAEDDRVGQPFRGKAGELLQAMLRAVGMTPEARVYYTHLLKCRPVGNRAPSADEVAACMAHLRQQIALARPRQMLVLGRVAAQALLGDVPVEALRGRLHTYEQDGIATPVVVTYHPAALLSRPRHKAAAWQDLSLLQLQVTGTTPQAERT